MTLREELEEFHSGDPCPWCGKEGTTHQITCNDACGSYSYIECFDCGWCSDEVYEDGYWFGNPDIEWEERDLWKSERS